MNKWRPDVEAARFFVEEARNDGMKPEMIGFKIGWKWAHDRVLKHSMDQMVEMCQLHEQEKRAMLAAWRGNHEMAMRHALNAAALKPYMMACLVVVGFIGGLWI